MTLNHRVTEFGGKLRRAKIQATNKKQAFPKRTEIKHRGKKNDFHFITHTHTHIHIFK